MPAATFTSAPLNSQLVLVAGGLHLLLLQPFMSLLFSLPAAFPGPPVRRVIPLLLGGVVLGAGAGCANRQPEPRPLAAEQTAAAFDGRSLAREDLRRYLVANLHRDFPVWPLPVWDFENLSWVAFYYNPTLDVARAQWDVARAGVQSAGARPNPTLSLTPGYNTSAAAGVSPWFPALTLDFLFETARKRELRGEVARLTAEAARQAVFTTVWQVRSELRQALLEIPLAGVRADAWQVQVDVQRRILTLLEQRLNAGAISANEVATARLALVRAEAAAADAQRQLAVVRQHLARVLGVSGAALTDLQFLAPMPVDPPLATQLAATRRQSLQSRADVLGALARYEATQAELALEVAKRNPDLHLGPGYQWDQGENKWSLSLSLELPFFNRHEGPIAEAEARRREAAAQFLGTQARAVAEIDDATAALSAAQAQMASLRRLQQEMAQQQARLEARMKAGGADQLEIQTARLQIAATALALAEARAQAAAAAGRLEDALQVPFTQLAELAPSGPVPPLPVSP